nr:hypothetical protein [Polymorphobacter sp.]
MTSLRSRLFHGTAVAALALLPTTAQAAPVLPNLGTIAAGTVVASGTNATVVGGGTFGAGATPIVVTGVANNGALNLTVGAGAGAAGQSAVVNWDSFSIGSTAGTNNAVTFKGAGDLAFSVLNRVTNAANPTTIAGTLQGNVSAAPGNRGTIFVVNEAGVSFANSATVTNLTGFVASSLGVTDAEFAKFASGTTQFTGTGANSVSVAADAGVIKATIAPDSVLLLVAPKLDIQGGALSAAGGDAALVLASDATVALNSTSIISIKIDAGATVSTAQTLAGTIGGKRVLVAAATSADLVGALLNVTGDLTATTATATNQGIVIAIGRNAPIDATNAITFTPAGAGPPVIAGAQFVGGLAVTGALTSSARIDTAVSGATSIAVVAATGGASFVSGGALAFTGNISAGGGLTGAGTSIVLGVDGAAHSFVSTGAAVGLTASGGAITALGDYTISGSGAVTLETSPGIAANFSQDGSLAITGSTIFVGNIASNPAATLVGTGDVVLTATSALNAGTVVAQGAVTASSAAGAVTLGGATSGSASATGHAVTVTAGGAATVSGAVASTGNYTVNGGSVSLGGTQAAAGDVLVKSTTGDIATTGSLTADSGGAGGHVLVLDSAAAISGGGSLAGGPARQSDILIAVAGDTTLGTIGARSLASAASITNPGSASVYTATTADTLSTAGAISLGAVSTTHANAIGSTGTLAGHRDVTIGGDTSTAGGVGLSAMTGDVLLIGAVSAAGAASLHADLGTLTIGDVKAFGGNATLTGTTAIAKASGAHVIAASGNVALKSDGAIAVDAVRAGAAITAGGSTGASATSLTSDSLRGGGAVTVTAGTISLAGINAKSAQSTGKALDTTLTTFTGAAVAAADVTLTSGGAITLNDVASTANITGSAAAFTLGTASATHSLAAVGAVTLTATNLGPAAITVLGDYAVAGGGAVALQRSAGVGANVTHDDTLTITGANVLVGDIALVTTLLPLVGTGNVALTANGAAATDSISAGVVAARNAVTVDSAHGAVVLGGAISGGAGAVTVSAATSADVTGAVSSAGDYTVVANGITLATAGAPQSAVGNILIQSSGNIFASGTLVADSAGAGAKRLVLDAMGGLFNAGAGPVSLTAGSGATATAANRSDILLSLGSGTNLALGSVDADVFSNATHAAGPLTVADYDPAIQAFTLIPTLITSGAISSTGAINTVQSIIIGSTGSIASQRDVSLAGVTSRAGSVEVSATSGAVTLNGPVSAATFAMLHADAATLTLGNISAFGGNATLTGARAIAKTPGVHAIAALGDVVLASPGAVTVDAVRAGGTATVRGLTTGSSAASLTGTSIAANVGVTISTTGTINLIGAGLTVATPRQAIDANLGGFNGANVGNADIALTSTGGAVTIGAIAATGSILLNAATTATVSGNAEAGFGGGSGDYGVKGATVSLGGAGTTQKATGNVWIRAGVGGIFAAGTIIADDNGFGGQRLVLDSAAAIGGGANLTAGAGVGPTTTNRSAILITLGDTTKPVSLGSIDGLSLSLANPGAATSVASYTPIVAGRFETAGAVSLGAVSTVASNIIGSTGTAVGQRDVVIGGDTSTTGSVEVRSAAGAVAASGPVIAATGVNLHADFTPVGVDPAQGLLTVADVTASAGDATLTGGTAIATASTANTIAATGNVLLASPGSIAIGSARAGGTITARGLAVGSSASSLSGVGLAANGAITATTTGAISLTGTGAQATATRRGAFTIASGFAGANVADADVTLTGSTVTVADAGSTGNLSLTGSGAVGVTGTVTAGDAFTAGGSGNYSVTAGSITLGGTGIVQSATGAVALASPGAVTVGTVRAGKTITVSGLTLGSAAGSLTGTVLQANGAVTVLTSGAISLTGTGAVKTSTERALFDPTLRTFTGATTAADADATLTSTGGTVTIADAATTGNLTIMGSGAVTVTGIIAAGDGATAAGHGTYTVAGSSIALGGGVAGQAALGDILLETPGAMTLTALRSGGAVTARGLAAGSNAASLAGDSIQANGAIDVATIGAITLAGLNATSIATRRNHIDADLAGFGGAATAPDAGITLATVAGSISVNGGSSTGSTTLTAGTGGVSGGISATGLLTAGDASTITPLADLVLDARDTATLANGSATRNIGVTSHAGDATITVATAGTNSVGGGAITAQTLAAGRTATIASGTTTLGDIKALATAAGGTANIGTATATLGNVLADGDASATITSGTTLGAVSTGDVTAHSLSGNATITTGRARGSVVADAFGAALVSDGVSVAADISATSRSTTGGSATITLADARNITADAQFGPASIVSGQSLVSGDITATVHTGGNLASIGTATANGGNIAATQSGSGNATIAAATASGNVTATAGGLADITTGAAAGDVIASGATAHIASGHATGSVRALASGGTAVVDLAIADNGNVDALASTDATITSGTATLGNVRATATGGGLATISTGIAGTSVVATGGSVTIGTATAGDDIIASATTGAVSATTLTVTGLGTDTAATDASGALLTGALTGLGGSNAIIRAATSATIGGVVSIAQANAAKTANYDVGAASVTLGTVSTAFDQHAAGRVAIVATGGGVTFAGSSGTLQSNVGGLRTANALADVSTAGGGLSIGAATSIDGATTTLIANAKTLGIGFDTQARQPGIVLAAAAGGGGSIRFASLTGGAVTVTAPATIAIPTITATGNVSLTGVATSGNDTATISPVAITIDGLNSGYAPVDVTAAGGAGAEIVSLGVAHGGQVGALQILSDSGAATLRSAPSDPTKITSILVESQTGVAGILNPAGGAASIANLNTVAAQTIVLRGRQAGSSVLATGPLLATGSILATGPSVTLGTVVVAGTVADGSGDISIAATNSASLAAGAGETAVARRSINLSGGTALLGDGTATGGTLAVSGTSVVVTRSAVAGDDVVLTSLGAITATDATVTTTGSADLQAGNDSLGIGIVTTGAAAGTGYGAGHTVITDVVATGTDATTGGALTALAGANIVATADGNIDFAAATLSAASGLGRDIHIESNGTVALADTTAARGLVVASNGGFTPTGTQTAGDDLVLVSTGAIDVRGATLRTVGASSDLPDARRADGSLLTNAAGGGALSALGGSNIALAAGGIIQLGLVQTAGAAPSSLHAFSAAAVTAAQSITTSGSIVLVGTTVAAPFALTAGDDIVAIARSGAATLDGVLTTTGASANNAALTDLAGNGIALPGEATLGRTDGASILVAATGLSTVSANVASAGRYSVYGRGGIALGTAAASAPGTSQGAARDILLEASIGAAPLPASIALANNMVLTANSDGVEIASGGGYIADSLVVRLGNGDLNAGGATLRALRTPVALLADQATVEVQPVVADGVKSITIATLDSARADLRALNDVMIENATVDAGLTLASKAGAVSLGTLTVGTGTPSMTPAQVAAIDLKLSGATGATLGTLAAAANRIRDITVATSGGAASITGSAGARDDIVVASATGAASANSLSFVGAASDSEAGVATVAATDANGVALADPYHLGGATITGLAGRNIVVSGATGASLGTVTTAATGGLGDVRVTTAAGPATLNLVNTGGAGLPARVIVATRNGAATGTTLNASGDIIVDATLGSATLTTGNAGRDAIVVGPTVSIGTLTAGDDIVAVATAGTLTAGILTATGANAGDAIATIFRADGSPIADPVAGGAVGGLTGGNVVALASGNLTVTTASAPGLVRLASLNGTTMVTTITGGDVFLTGFGVVAGTVTAGRDATIVSTGSDISIATVVAARDLVLNSANDIVVGGLSSAGGNATLTAVRDISLGATATGDALDTIGNATLTSGRDIVVAQRTSAGAGLSATAGGAATFAGTASGGTTSLATQANLILTADAAAGGAMTLASAAGSITAPNVSGNGITIAAANAATITGAATSTGALTATGGSLAFGSISTALDATLHATGLITVTGATVTGGALTATSDTAGIRTGAVTTGGPATITASNASNGAIVLASLGTAGAATLVAGQSIEVTGAATSTGALTATAANGSLKFGSIAAGGAATLRARTALTVAGLAKSGGALDALSSAGALSLGSTQAATTLTLRGATGVAVAGASTAGGAATITADAGPILTGNISAGGDTLVAATGGSATLASVSRTAKLTLTAATDATISGAVTTTGDTAITATHGSATIGGAVTTANYTVKANNGTIALAGATQASSGTMTLDSQRLTIGAGTTLVAAKRIQLDVTGNAAGISLGDGAGAAAGSTKYALSKADLRKFQTPMLEIAAVARPVDIGEVDLDGVAAVSGGFAGITSAFGVRTTGDIRVADRLTFTSAATATTPRVLTLGGAAGGADLDKTTTTANAIKVLAVAGLDNSVTGTGGQINAAGSTVQLRATYIALGEAPSPAAGRPFIDALLPTGGPLTTAEARTQFVNNSTSSLYLATPPYSKQTLTPQALVKAGTLVLAPGQWALIQNTGPTTTPGGGIEAGTLKFNRVGGAAAADPVIAVFGSIAGKTGIASAISVSAGNLDGISPNNIRVNGCVALSTSGCIQSAVSIPLINLADPGRTLLISSAPDLALSVELITGATNEALWREDDDDCAPGKDRCAATPAQNSPQRESRP